MRGGYGQDRMIILRLSGLGNASAFDQCAKIDMYVKTPNSIHAHEVIFSCVSRMRCHLQVRWNANFLVRFGSGGRWSMRFHKHVGDGRNFESNLQEGKTGHLTLASKVRDILSVAQSQSIMSRSQHNTYAVKFHLPHIQVIPLIR